MRIVALSLALIAVGALAAPPPTAATAQTAQSARVARTTDLRDQPGGDGKLLKVLPADAAVSVFERKGGWYRVQAGTDGGWLRLTSVRFATAVPSESSGGIAAPLRFLQSGRAAVTSGTVTTGVRGLSETELQNAVPNPAAVDALESLAVGADDARGFAAGLKLAPIKLDYVKPPKSHDEKSGGG